MLQETMDEGLSRQGTEAGLLAGGMAIREGHLTVDKLVDALIADGDSEDVGRQVLEGCHAIAHGLAMNDPILGPDFPGDLVKPFCLQQRIAELGAKEDG